MTQVLVIDDNPLDRKVLRDLLAHVGFAVEEATDGAAGLRQLYACHPDLILLDVMMPLGNGYHVIEQLRKIPALAQTPVVLMNSVPPPDGLPILWQAFLKKPLSIATLLDTIEQFIGPPLAEPIRRS